MRDNQKEMMTMEDSDDDIMWYLEQMREWYDNTIYIPGKGVCSTDVVDRSTFERSKSILCPLPIPDSLLDTTK